MNWVDLLLVALLIAIVAAVYTRYAVRIGNFQNDEEQYLRVARYIAAHFPSALWKSGLFARGSQRMDQLVLALPFASMRGPGAFELAHAIQSLMFASTALPVLLLARRAGLGRAAGLFAATLSVVVPWAVVSTSFLTECIAYPAFCWVLYATWVAARRPRARNDALALLAVAIAALSRTALLALAPLLPLAVLWHEWSWELRGRRWRRRARQLPAQLWSRHRLLTTVVGAAAIVLVADRLGLLPGRGLAALAGEYGLPHPDSLSGVASRYESYLSRLVVGTGFLAAALALPWVIANLARPLDGGRHALAAICTLGVAMMLLSLLQAPPDERYVLYGAAPIALAAAGTLREWAYAPRRSLGMAVGVVAAAVALVVLIDDVAWPEMTNQYDFFSFPAAVFYQRAVLQHLSTLRLPLLHPSPQLLAYVGIVAVACAFAALGLVKRVARPAAALVAVGLLAMCATQTIYALRKFSQTAGAASGPDAAQRSWVDRSVPSSVQVGALAISMGMTADYLPIWRATEFWNTSVQYDSSFGPPGLLPFQIGSEPRPLTAQANSGLLIAASEHRRASPQLVPRYMLIPRQGTNSIGLDAQLVAEDPSLPLELVRLTLPPRIDWSIGGTSPEGFMPAGRPATAIVYSGALAGPARRCARFLLIPPPDPTRRWSYRVTSAGRRLAQATLGGSQTASVSAPLLARASAHGPSAELAVYAKARPVAINGVSIGVRLAYFSVGACSASGR
ncbi:MAG TPA: hypothetical protein VGY30_02565 [Solirubrobacteraceae bacterium]|nr:hypothetical protein [Solirubrobacteraceae bacterium]